MASGMFPLDDGPGEWGGQLLRAARAVEEVCDEAADIVYRGEDGQFDNAASDGGSLALLRLAVTLIRRQVQVQK